MFFIFSMIYLKCILEIQIFIFQIRFSIFSIYYLENNVPENYKIKI
jgi:hypothetical protein